MSLMSVCCQSSCFGWEEMYSLTSFRSLSKRTSCASKWTRRPLRKRKSTVGSPAGGLGHHGARIGPRRPRIWSSRFVFQPSLSSP